MALPLFMVGLAAGGLAVVAFNNRDKITDEIAKGLDKARTCATEGLGKNLNIKKAQNIAEDGIKKGQELAEKGIRKGQELAADGLKKTSQLASEAEKKIRAVKPKVTKPRATKPKTTKPRVAKPKTVTKTVTQAKK